MEEQDYALIPHKDQLLALSRFQKKFLTEYNISHKKKPNTSFPKFPLWAIFQTDFRKIEKDCLSCTVTGFSVSNGTVDFRISLKTKDTTFNLKIPFAEKTVLPDMECLNGQNTPEWLTENPFPINLRVFRTGPVSHGKNSISLLEEKWISIKKI